MLVALSMRFYFNLAKGDQRIFDRAGLELTHEAVMSPSVFQIVRRIWPGTTDATGWEGWSVEIVDSDGHLMRVIALV